MDQNVNTNETNTNTNETAQVVETSAAANAFAALGAAVTNDTPATPEATKERKGAKSDRSRAIMREFYGQGKSYEEIIAEMQRVNGYQRQLARATFKFNAEACGIPADFIPKREAKVKQEAAPAANTVVVPGAQAEAAADTTAAPAVNLDAAPAALM